MASRVTPAAEEEGAEVEGTKEEGVVGDVGLSFSIHGRFDRSWASLCRTELAGTHNGEVRRVRNGDGEVLEDPRDS